MKLNFNDVSFLKRKGLHHGVLLIMKITTVLMLVSCLQVSAHVRAQTITFNQRQATLEEVFHAIRKQSGYEFLYNTLTIRNAMKMDLHLDHAPLKQALNKIFARQPFTYRIIGNTIVVHKKGIEGIPVPSKGSLNVPQFIVQGKVADPGGHALVGVSVSLKGTSTGTITDGEGNFSLTLPDDQGTLVFTYIGFTSKEVAVDGRDRIDISLEPSISSLDQLVVIGYGVQKKRDLTGSVASVNAEEIEKIPVATVDQALQGRAPGVQITSDDASPGSAVSIKIRGTGTFGDNSPLYVVDGYPIAGGDLSALNPADIATIDILKDASATAIYGSRASNGVVIITTKRGNTNELQVSLNASASMQAKPPKYDLMNAQQFVTLAQYVADQFDYPILPEWKQDPSGLRSIDWQDAFYQTGFQQNYDIALRGGSDKIKSALSLGYYNRQGNVIFSNFKRYNASLNLDYTPNKWLKASTSLKYSHFDRVVRYGSGVNGLANLVKQIPTMTGNPETDQLEDANGNFGFYTKGAMPTTGMNNIYADVAQQDQDNPSGRLLASGYIEITPIEGLKLKSNFGINLRNHSSYYFTPSNDRTTPAPLAYYSRSANQSSEWLWENTVSYSRVFGIHSIDFVGGISAQQNKFSQVGASGNGLISNELRDIASLQQGLSAYGNQQIWSLASQFGRLTYKLKDRYIVTGTVRRDGSSRFGPDHKWGTFPSVSAAWVLKEESFLSHADWITNLKIRGSWGQSGNQNIALFQYLGLYGSGSSQNDNRGYVFGPGNAKVYYQGLVLNVLPDPELTWETTTQSDVGLDASFLGGKINFTADYYQRVSSGFLLNVPIPAQTGFTTATRNVGSIRNRGLELSLDYNQSEHPFKWDISANVTFLKNKILSFADGLDAIGNFSSLNFRNYGGSVWTVYSQSEVGGVVGAFYGFKTDGIFQSQDEVDNLNKKAVELYGPGSYYQVSQTSAGDRKFVDVNKDGRITDDDRVIIGSPIPKFFGGLSFNGSFKQWDFSLYFYGVYGNQILNYMKRNLQNFDKADGVGLQNMSVDYFKNHWTEKNHSTEYPRVISYDQNGNNRVSDAFVEDGSYLRLRNLQIGYTLPSSVLSRLSIDHIRVYLSTQNLFTITGYSGLDPEVGNAQSGDVTSNGVDVGNYPTSHFYTLGLNVTF